ncbi:uncharacterized protein LOC133891642 isoform X2 [Phragmites australis]|uniref:uncharacterized protein LOC133891642 isoform X2 n=1 Tax=Phragmites australis TaxID=29695 RepID=UPI002D79D045|nr:uncharacterized protein LOC133891642 isoform X2 [Phragmites australis]
MRGIWEKIRSAVCISGGNRRRPPTPSSPNHAAADGEGRGGGGVGEEDLISSLPDDVLLLVLLRLPSAAVAARTCVLSHRWRRLWAHLPELRFPHPTDLVRARAALTAHADPALRLLRVVASGADPGDVAAVLLLAAPRLTGDLFFHNMALEEHRAGAGGAVELPCFEKSERIFLHLGYLGLMLPQSGVFAKLTVLRVTHVRFHGPCDLGDALSSARCPSLRDLRIDYAQGVSNLAVHSESLLIMDLFRLEGLQQLTVVAPMLTKLCVFGCFLIGSQPVADISAPVLETLWWSNVYDPSSVQFGELAHLQRLTTYTVARYGSPDYLYSRDTVMLLQHFKKIPILDLQIAHPYEAMVNSQDLMEVLTLLPDIEMFHLLVSINGHAFGPCVLHLLRISPGIRKLKLTIHEDIQSLVLKLMGLLREPCKRGSVETLRSKVHRLCATCNWHICGILSKICSVILFLYVAETHCCSLLIPNESCSYANLPYVPQKA